MSPRFPLKTWRRLAVIVNRLAESSTSRYAIAVENDPELAVEKARAQREARKTGTGGGYRPPAEEWDARAVLEAQMVDRLGEMLAVLADMPMATKKRRKPPKPWPRPWSAVEEAEQLLAEEHIEEIIADVEDGYMTDDEYRQMVAEMEAEQAAAEAAATPDEQQGGAHAVAST
jgi:hypothetical protein